MHIQVKLPRIWGSPFKECMYVCMLPIQRKNAPHSEKECSYKNCHTMNVGYMYSMESFIYLENTVQILIKKHNWHLNTTDFVSQKLYDT